MIDHDVGVSAEAVFTVGCITRAASTSSRKPDDTVLRH
jgi:hypothetical protein